MSQTKEFNQLKARIAKSVRETLLEDCNPPPDELHIPFNLVLEDEENPWHAFARATYVVFCPKKKVHTVTINFRYDKFGKFQPETMKYV
jgi:hypothetical protein